MSLEVKRVYVHSIQVIGGELCSQNVVAKEEDIRIVMKRLECCLYEGNGVLKIMARMKLEWECKNSESNLEEGTSSAFNYE